MPDPAGHKDHNDVQDIGPIAAEAQIHIITQPERQGHMPSPPKFARRGGHVGLVEISRQIDAEEFSEPDGHQGIRPEIEIDDQAVGQDRIERIQSAAGREIMKLMKGAQHVGEQNFIGQAPGQEFDPAAQIGRQPGLAGDAVQLAGDLFEAQDRPGDQLRKEADEGGELDRIFLRRHRAVADINQVRYDLECVEADACRQDVLQDETEVAARPGPGADDIQGEPQIFENKQKTQRRRHGADDDPEAIVAGNEKRHQRRPDNGHHQKREGQVAGNPIKKERRRQQHRQPRDARRHMEHDDHQRQKHKQEFRCIEIHFSSPADFMRSVK